jgi:antitoxin component HigA of HigAB toxin-antitoxin module
MVEKTPIDLTMDRLAVNNVLKLQQLKNELEFERASSMFVRIRKEAKEDPFLSEVRNHLKKLIKNYEQKYWNDEKQISEEQIKENDLAEKLVRDENEFIHKRKELIRNKLKEFNLNQNDLARILGHQKGYMSELINGLRPFSKEDIIIVHRLLKIEFGDLIPPFIPQKRAAQIKNVLKKLPAGKAKLKKQDLENAF